MNTPRTTKFTLKRIIENLGKIPDKGFGEDAKKLTPEQKQKLMQMTSMFENFGECLSNEEALMNSAKGITELCELAESYAINECGDWFLQDIVKKDMNELKKRVGEFQKITKEAYARMQQLGVAYQDIGHVLGRYYDLKKPASIDQPSVMDESEDDKKTTSKETNLGSTGKLSIDVDKQSKKIDKRYTDPSGMTPYERRMLGSHGITSID